MFTDTHCHLASKQFTDIEEILRRADEEKIHRIISVATTLEDSRKCVKLAEKYPQIFATVGIHPCYVTKHSLVESIKELRTLCQHPKVVAIGETGLDYFHSAPSNWNESKYLQLQEHFFIEQILLASEMGLNIIVHTRDKNNSHPCFNTAFNIIEKYKNKSKAVFHCFILNSEILQKCLNKNHFVSFTGIATFPKNDCLKTAIACPKNTFMLETDAPYLSPNPHRGKRNEPSFITHIAKKIANARNETLTDLSQHTEKCVKKFFSKKGKCLLNEV